VRWWKVLGLAGFVGVAATGVVIARAERRRRAYTPEQIRARLHERFAEASGAAAEDAKQAGAGPG
jgi:predicted ATPase